MRTDRFVFCNRVVDLLAGTVVYAGDVRRLTSRQAQLLEHLIDRQGDLVTRAELIDALWDGNHLVGDRGLTEAIYQLRKTLGDDEQTPLIKTVPRRGYVVASSLGISACDAVSDALVEGAEIPTRPGWTLIRRLSKENESTELWLIRNKKSYVENSLKVARNSNGVELLRREVSLHRLLRDLTGTNAGTVVVLDWNVEESPAFIQYEYVEQGDVQAWSSSRGGVAEVPFEDWLSILEKVAEAIARLHAAGIVHNDLGPEQILIHESDGQPKPVINGLSHYTRTAEEAHVVREPHDRSIYTPPEAWDQVSADPGSDVYSLGVLLYQIAVGDLSKPFPVDWRSEVSDPILAEDIQAATQSDPRARPGARDLAARLGNYRVRFAEFQRHVAEQAVKEQKRRMLKSAFVVLPLLLLIIYVSWSHYAAAKEEAEEAQDQLVLTQDTVSFFVALFNRIDPLESKTGSVDINRIIDLGIEQATQRFENQHEVRYRLLGHLADIKFKLGSYIDAANTYRVALGSAELADANIEVIARLANGLNASALRTPTHAMDNDAPFEHPLNLLETEGLVETEVYFWAMAHQGAHLCFRYGGHSDECKRTLEAALEISTQLGDKKLTSYILHSQASSHLPRTEQAVEGFSAALSMAIPAWGNDHPVTNHIRLHLAEAHDRAGRYQKAAGAYRRAYMSSARLYGEHSPTAMTARLEWAVALAKSSMDSFPVEEIKAVLYSARDESARNVALVALARAHVARQQCEEVESALGSIKVEHFEGPSDVPSMLYVLAVRDPSDNCPGVREVALNKIIEGGDASGRFLKFAKEQP